MNYIDRIPSYTLHTLKMYVEYGVPTGGFLHAVLSNDLMGAICRADDENLKALPDIATYVYNRIPAASWGTKEKVWKWLENHPNRNKVIPVEMPSVTIELVK